MRNNNNRKLVNIILNYTKTRILPQKITELVDSLESGATMQDFTFLSALGIPIFAQVGKVSDCSIQEVEHLLDSRKVTFEHIKKALFMLVEKN